MIPRLCGTGTISFLPSLATITVMNYVDPVCWAEFGEFTLGQRRRMLAIFEQFRLSNPWQCSQPQQRCRKTFECCDKHRCSKNPGERFGTCVKRCSGRGTACAKAMDCCGDNICRSGVCRANVTQQPSTGNGGTGGRRMMNGCTSVICG